MKETKLNYKAILESTISALQETYTQYKKAYYESIRWTWYDKDGEFCILSGQDERNDKLDELGQEVIRLRNEVLRLKQEMYEKEK